MHEMQFHPKRLSRPGPIDALAVMLRYSLHKLTKFFVWLRSACVVHESVKGLPIKYVTLQKGGGNFRVLYKNLK
jgi:hypothetical protein